MPADAVLRQAKKPSSCRCVCTARSERLGPSSLAFIPKMTRYRNVLFASLPQHESLDPKRRSYRSSSFSFSLRFCRKKSSLARNFDSRAADRLFPPRIAVPTVSTRTVLGMTSCSHCSRRPRRKSRRDCPFASNGHRIGNGHATIDALCPIKRRAQRKQLSQKEERKQ